LGIAYKADGARAAIGTKDYVGGEFVGAEGYAADDADFEGLIVEGEEVLGFGFTGKSTLAGARTLRRWRDGS